MKYDSVCMNEECIKERISFFSFDVSSYHFLDHHPAKSIHPLTYVSYFDREDASEMEGSSFDARSLYKELVAARDAAYDQVIDAVKSIFYDDTISAFEQSLSLAENLNLKTLVAKLSEGNYAVLECLKHFEQQKKEKNFHIFLINSIKSIQEEMRVHFNTVKLNLLKECFKIKSKKFRSWSMNEREEVHVAPLSHGPSESEHINHRANQLNAFIKEQYVPSTLPRYLSLQESEDEEGKDNDEDEDSEGQNEQPIEKSKSVQKEEKRLRKRRKNYNIMGEIEALSEDQVIVKECRNTIKTLQHLYQHYTSLKTIHIFNEKMANKLAVKALLKNFTKIERITINCYFQFEPEVLSEQIPKEILNRLKIQLNWDMNRWFTEYFAYIYFPYKNLRRRERKKKMYNDQIAKFLPCNDSIWISDNESLYQLDKLCIRHDNITVLHFSASEKGSFDRFQLPRIFRNIRTLILKNIPISGDPKNFDQFMMKNESLSTIVISGCDLSSYKLKDMLSYMKKLNQLSKLSISSPKSQGDEIDPEAIFSLINLTHLNIDRYSFKASGQDVRSTNLRGLDKLTKLTYLNLYSSKFYSDSLEFLFPKCLYSLTFLNLGRTLIDNTACQYLKKMTSLKYLNIDHTKIDGEAFLDVYMYISRQSIHESTLKYLSIEDQFVKPEKKLSTAHLIEIAKYLPKLTYLNIAFNENVMSYNFADFKNLKTLAVDKEQYEKLEPIISHEVTRFKVNSSGETS